MWRVAIGIGWSWLCLSLPLARAFGEVDLKPMADGPVHEAFLSPRHDLPPTVVPNSPPPPVVERPTTDPPTIDASWVGGYWEWVPESSRFVWVTGSWRVPPPGRFWVNGYWTRDAEGWRRVAGYWSDRSTDRVVVRKDGPPDHLPPDDPGSPPRPDCFYIPGCYVPEGDGIAWRKGFWTESRPGWAWVPAGWNRQPEGWIFQPGYWDRPLDERGTLFAPAEPVAAPTEGRRLSYRPVAIVSPELYGRLYGAFGRWSPWYDGYPGVCYDDSGRLFAYAEYGRLAPFLGYLDYPSFGAFGYPYFASPIVYPTSGSLAAGLGPPYYGFGNLLLPLMAGYPLLGGFGTGLAAGGWGWGWPGWSPGAYAAGIPGWSGVALGTWPGFGWGTWGWSGPTLGAWPSFLNVGYPNWFSGWSGYGWGIFGFGGWGWNGLVWGGNPIWGGLYPYPNAVCVRPTPRSHPTPATTPTPHPLPSHLQPANDGHQLAGIGSMRQGPERALAPAPPPSTRPLASLESRPALVGMRTSRPNAGRIGPMRSESGQPASWLPGRDALATGMMREHRVARPAFARPSVGTMAGRDAVRIQPGGPALNGMRATVPNAAAGGFFPQLGPGLVPSPRGAESLINPNQGQGWRGAMRGPSPSGIHPDTLRAAGALQPGFQGLMRAPWMTPSVAPAPSAGMMGNGFTGGFRQPGGFANSGNFGAGVYNGGSMFGGGMRSADPGGGMGMGGMRGGGMGGMSGGMGGFGGGMRGGGMGGGMGSMGGGMGSMGGGMGGGGFGGHMR